MSRGGARENSGAKKGQHRVHVKELKDAIETHLGKPFQEIQAIVFLKLFNDFQGDSNVKEFLIFNENMCRRILEQPTQDINVSSTQLLTDEQLKDRVAALMTVSKDDEETKTD